MRWVLSKRRLALPAAVLGLVVIAATAAVGLSVASAASTAECSSPTISKEGFGSVGGRSGRSLHAQQLQRAWTSRSSPTAGSSRRSTSPTARADVANVTLGFDNLDDYVEQEPRTSAASPAGTPTGSRRAQFTLDGADVPARRSTTTPTRLHGGTVGFDKRVWAADADRESRPVGAQAQPTPARTARRATRARSTVEVTYTLTDDNEIVIDYEATTDKADDRQPDQPRLLQPRRRGHRRRSTTTCSAQRRSLHPVDPTLIPTGEIAPVAGTPFDFRNADRDRRAHPRRTSSSCVIGRGYDHNWVLNRAEPGRHVADPGRARPRSRQRTRRSRSAPPSRASSSTPATSSTARSSARAATCTGRATGSRSRPSTTRTRRTTRTSPRPCSGPARCTTRRRSTSCRRRTRRNSHAPVSASPSSEGEAETTGSRKKESPSGLPEPTGLPLGRGPKAPTAIRTTDATAHQNTALLLSTDTGLTPRTSRRRVRRAHSWCL